MFNYLVTFEPREEDNSKRAIAIRSTLEDLSPNKWIQVFPNQIAIQSELSTDEIYQRLLPEAKDIRISIFRFDKWLSNETRSEDLLNEYDY